MARILFHSPSVRPDPTAATGPALAAHLLLEALAVSRHAVTMAVRFRLPGRPGDDDTRRRRLDAAAACQAARVLRECRRLAPEAAPELWLAFRPHPGLPDRLGQPVTAALGVPSLLVASGPAGAALPGPVPAAAVVAVGQEALDEAAAAAGVDNARLFPARPFLDLATLQPLKKTARQTRAALAARLQLPAEEPWLVAALTDDAHADASLAVLSEALSRTAGLPWRLILAQTGPTGAAPAGPRGSAAGDPQRCLAALPRQRVRLIGPVDRAGLLQVLSAADLFAWPAVGEAEALALLQAQALGLAAVAGRTPAAADIVVDGRTGRLAAAGNPASFANNLTFLLRHPQFLATYRHTAAETALADHGLAKAADALDAAIEGASVR
jgi:hypothetical protein